MRRSIVVGAGLSGVVIARKLAESGENVLLIDRRKTVGGNVYDKTDKNGIRIQYYGPHIFHTNYKEVFEFLSKYTEWQEYEHKVLALIKHGKKRQLVPVPFNLTSLFKLYNLDDANEIKDVLIKEIGYGKKVPILTLKQHESDKVRAFADFVYKNVFYYYTQKQWGFKPEELGETVMNRVPVYLSEEDGYFTDEYQYQPKNGFAEMVKNILNHPNIHVQLGIDANKIIALKDGEIYYKGKPFDGNLIYTGCIDELFDYKYGTLPYRSLRFKFKNVKKTSYQPSAVVNYTTSKKFTRISEFTKFSCAPVKGKTVIVKEFPVPYVKGKNIPYYPIPKTEYLSQHQEYVNEAKNYKNLYLLGRLAEYKYVNMDVAVKNALDLYEKICEE